MDSIIFVYAMQYFFGCLLLLCLHRPFCIFERCLDSNSCRELPYIKQERYQLSLPSSLISHPFPPLSHPSPSTQPPISLKLATHLSHIATHLSQLSHISLSHSHPSPSTQLPISLTEPPISLTQPPISLNLATHLPKISHPSFSTQPPISLNLANHLSQLSLPSLSTQPPISLTQPPISHRPRCNTSMGVVQYRKEGGLESIPRLNEMDLGQWARLVDTQRDRKRGDRWKERGIWSLVWREIRTPNRPPEARSG